MATMDTRDALMNAFKVGDRVTCKVAPETYVGSTAPFNPGDVGTVAAIAPKVRIVPGPGKDRRQDFLVVDFPGGRCGLNFCNTVAVKVESAATMTSKRLP